MKNRKSDLFDIEELELSIRAYSSLKRAGIRTVGQLRDLSVFELMHIRNLGGKSVDEIMRKLAELEKREKKEQMLEEKFLEEFRRMRRRRRSFHRGAWSRRVSKRTDALTRG